jgi:hypothetical protein
VGSNPTMGLICQVDVSETYRSLLRRSPTECDVSECVTKSDVSECVTECDVSLSVMCLSVSLSVMCH